MTHVGGGASRRGVSHPLPPFAPRSLSLALPLGLASAPRCSHKLFSQRSPIASRIAEPNGPFLRRVCCCRAPLLSRNALIPRLWPFCDVGVNFSLHPSLLAVEESWSGIHIPEELWVWVCVCVCVCEALLVLLFKSTLERVLFCTRAVKNHLNLWKKSYR